MINAVQLAAFNGSSQCTPHFYHSNLGGRGGENPFTFEAQIHKYLTQQNGIFADHDDAIFSTGCTRGVEEEKQEKEKCTCLCTKYGIQSGLAVCKFYQHNFCVTMCSLYN
jgi:hypothetical protein